MKEEIAKMKEEAEHKITINEIRRNRESYLRIQQKSVMNTLMPS